MLTDEQTSPEQFAIYRRMTPQQRLEIAEQLYWSAWKTKMSELRNEHPNWSEQQLKNEVRRIFDQQNPES